MARDDEKQLPPVSESRLADAAHPRAPRPHRLRLILMTLGLVIAALFLFGFYRHWRQEKNAGVVAANERSRIPSVVVVRVGPAPATTELLLPGTIIPITEAFLYARASGYVRSRYVDIGDRVRRNQLLATIESPDLDEAVKQGRATLRQSEQQLQQTRAALEDARAQLDLASITWKRYQVLASHGAIARQDADAQFTTYRTAQGNVAQAAANVAAAEHNVGANRANLERLLALQGFEQLRAPFAGVITARTFDIGALISGGGGTSGGAAGGSQASSLVGNAGAAGASSLVSGSANAGAGGELFRIAQIHRLRILVNVPQENARWIAVGQEAAILVAQADPPEVNGRVTRTAEAIDPNTRTLLTEVQVANDKENLLPGMYAQVRFIQRRETSPPLAPAGSIMASAKGIQVAVVDEAEDRTTANGDSSASAKRVHIQDVSVGRDYGAQIEITRGLKSGDLVVLNPSDVIQEGALVRPVTGSAQGASEASGPPHPARSGSIEANGEIPGKSDSGGRGVSAPRGGATR